MVNILKKTLFCTWIWGFTSCLTLIGSSARAQSYGVVIGSVVDSLNSEPLVGANVMVVGTLYGASTDRRGRFVIQRLQAGEYTLRADYIGYARQDQPIVLQAGDTLHLRFALLPRPIELSEIIVTASRMPEPVQKAVVSVNTLRRDAALRRSTLRLDAVLETIPGVNLMGENVNIRNSTGYTRGLGSRVLVLLDGVPVLISDLGNMNWDLIPVTDIERVEVVKGPASALYGSFALGGVMNIITRSPTPEGKFLFRTILGVYDRPYYPEWRWTDRTLNYNRTDFSYSRQFGRLGLRVSLGRHESTGDRQNRHFQRWNATAKLIWKPSPRSEWVLFASYARDRRGEFVESRFDHPYKVPEDFLPYRLKLDASAVYFHYRRRLNPWLEMYFRASYVRQLTGNQFNVKGDFKPAQGPGSNLRLRAVLDSTVTFVVGLEYHYDFAEQRHFGRHFSYTLSPYVQQIWTPHPAFRLTLGLRYDHYYLLPTARVQRQFAKLDSLINPWYMGKEEQYLSPQIGMSFQPFPSTVIHAAVGRGIRIPALGERFLQFKIPIEFRANPFIRTETSLSYELGWRQRWSSHLSMEINGFWSYYHNLIEPVYVTEVTSFYATLVNINRARIRGVEAAATIRFWDGRIQVEASGMWSEPVILQGSDEADNALPVRFRKGQLLSYRPRLIAFISPSLRLGPVTLEADFSYASRLTREQVQIYKDDPRVPKKQFDARLLYRWRDITLQLIVRNLLQYHYTQLERNMNEVRNFALGLIWEN